MLTELSRELPIPETSGVEYVVWPAVNSPEFQKELRLRLETIYGVDNIHDEVFYEVVEQLNPVLFSRLTCKELSDLEVIDAIVRTAVIVNRLTLTTSPVEGKRKLLDQTMVLNHLYSGIAVTRMPGDSIAPIMADVIDQKYSAALNIVNSSDNIFGPATQSVMRGFLGQLSR